VYVWWLHIYVYLQLFLHIHKLLYIITCEWGDTYEPIYETKRVITSISFYI
jgi:hypothetical protein